MGHLSFFNSLAVTIFGVIPVVFLLIISSRYRDRLTIALTLFYSVFTIYIFIVLVETYLRLNIYPLYFEYFDLLIFSRLVARLGVLLSIVYWIFHTIPLRWSKLTVLFSTVLVIVGFIFRETKNKPVIEPNTGVHFHQLDLLDVASLIIYMIAYVSLISLYRRPTRNTDRRFVISIVVMLTIVNPVIAMDTFHIIPRTIYTYVFVYLSFIVVLYSFLWRRFLKNLRAPQSGADKSEIDLGFVAQALSEREREIIEYLIKGSSNKQIAAELFISLSTVKTHVYRIYKKLGIKNRVELIARCTTVPTDKS